VAPFNADVEWSNEGMQGAVRFLSRVFRLVEELKQQYEADWKGLIDLEETDEHAKALRRATHQTIQNVTDDIEKFQFNTYISWLMKYVNSIYDLQGQVKEPSRAYGLSGSEAVDTIVRLLAPAAPHSADELWSSLGNEGFTYHLDWPVAKAALAVEDSITIAVQVNGKLRDTLQMPSDVSQEQAIEAARASSKVQAQLEGKSIRKEIYVPGKLVNIVAS
jgi:leucyl-tRNA synthetase